MLLVTPSGSLNNNNMTTLAIVATTSLLLRISHSFVQGTGRFSLARCRFRAGRTDEAASPYDGLGRACDDLIAVYGVALDLPWLAVFGVGAGVGCRDLLAH
jgi:hypothetical protein